MLMYLALLCLLACLAGLLTRAIRAPFAQTLPLTLTGVSLAAYLFTGAGEKEWLPLFVLPRRRGGGLLRPAQGRGAAAAGGRPFLPCCWPWG